MEPLAAILLAVCALLLGLGVGLGLWFRERTRTGALAVERDAAREQLAAIKNEEARSQAAFSQLAGQALHQNSEQLANRARADLQGLLEPLKENLTLLEQQVQHLEKERKQAYGSIDTRLQQLGEAHKDLFTATTSLRETLRSTKTRGRWGEIQLKRVVELAGMQEHVAFQEQYTAGEGRPDMVIHLSNGGVLAVDAKVPFDAFAAAIEETNEELRVAKFRQHALAMRARVKELAQRKYWDQFDRAPEFVAMFVPGEPILAAAFEYDPTLLDEAMEQRVLVCSPVNLLALLKAVAYGWQQQITYQNSREISETGKELYGRLEVFLRHFGTVGARLDSAVDTFNKAVGSLQRMVMPSARRLKELGLTDQEPNAPEEIDRKARLTAPEEPAAEQSSSGPQ